MSDFKKASDFVLSFKMLQNLKWVALYYEKLLEGNNVGVLSNAFKIFWILSPCRIISIKRNQKSNINNNIYSHICYSTLQGHLIAGEEKFKVYLDKSTNDVIYEVMSVSQGNGILGKSVMFLIKRLQMRFLEDQSSAMIKLMRE